MTQIEVHIESLGRINIFKKYNTANLLHLHNVHSQHYSHYSSAGEFQLGDMLPLILQLLSEKSEIKWEYFQNHGSLDLLNNIKY